jgi:hypothetical protein
MMNQLLGAIVMIMLVATFLFSTLDGPRPLGGPSDRALAVAREAVGNRD